MAFPDGLSFVPDFLGPEETPPVLAKLRELAYKHDVFRGQLIKRSSAFFGREYVAAGRMLKPAVEFTDWLNGLVEKALPYCPAGVRFEQCIVTRYPPGAGIGWHKDADSFGDCILGISLGGVGRLRFRPLGSVRATADLTATSGSLYLMHGAARWEYQHELAPVLEERYSLTFRSLRPSVLTTASPTGPVPGFWLHQNVLTADQESHLVRHIEESGSLWEVDFGRRAQRYGFRYHYGAHRVSPVGPIRDWLQTLARFIHENGWMASVPDQATVQEYEPGAGISEHVDDPLAFGPDIVTISLLSACAYRLVPPGFGIAREFVVEPRSAIVLTGEARSVWKHGIPARKTDAMSGSRVRRSRRLSITFRTVNPGRTSC